MKRAHKVRVAIIVSLVAILTAGALTALASPDQTTECNVCHATNAGVSISSNATGVVNALVDVPFVLVVDASNSFGFAGRFAVSCQSGWVDNSQFLIDASGTSFLYVKDDQAGDTNAAQDAITATYTYTPQSAGSYTIRIYAAGRTGGTRRSNVLDVTVSVTAPDTTPPTVDSPGDIAYGEGQTGNTIVWNPSDANPSTYVVYRNSTPVKSGPWNSSSEAISVSVDGLALGVYNYTVEVTDIGSNSATDTVWVTVYDGTAPTIDSPVDFSILEGTIGNTINWNPYDLHPSNYEIYREGVLVKSGSWNSSSEAISVSVDGLALGVYNLTIVVYDQAAMTAVDTVFVTVYDGTPPTTDQPADVSYPFGTTGNSITWNLSDLHPNSYAVFRDGALIRSGSWNSTGETVTVSVDGLAIGIYNFTILITDIGGNTASDLVYVTVYDLNVPTINHPPDQNVIEGSSGNEVIWDPLDLNPSSYTVYRNGSIIRSGAWNSSSELISVSIDGLTLGVYNYTIIVTDLDTNSANDTVWVTVYDGTVPTVDSPSDISYNEGEIGGSITWDPADLHPVSYEIYRNGIVIKSGSWNSSSELVTVSVDGLAFGAYNFTLAVHDIGGNTVSDYVLVTVLDGTAPTLDAPLDIVYNEGDTGISIDWSPSDLHPVSYEIFRDGILVRSGAWNSSSEVITISVSGLVVGQYNFTIVVYDIGSNSATDMVLVSVSDGTSPVIDSPSDVTYNEGDTGNSITWSPSDLHPSLYDVFRNGTLIHSSAWNSTSETITISVDGLPFGVFNYTIVVTDIGDNTASDQVMVIVIPITTTSTTTTTTTAPTTTTTPIPLPPISPRDQLMLAIVAIAGIAGVLLIIAEVKLRRG